MGAEYLSYKKSIETHARAFLALIILGIGTVLGRLGSQPRHGLIDPMWIKSLE